MEEEKRDSFVFYRSFYDGIINLPKEEQANVIIAICEYSLNDNIPEDISPVAKAMLMVMKPNIDNATKRYKASVENGKKGGRPRKNKTEDEPKKNLKKPNQNLKKPSNNLDEPNQNLNVNDNDNDNVNDNYNINNNIINNNTVADNLFIFLETNFARTISPIESEQLLDWRNDFNDEIIKYAITICCNNNAKNINYLNAILNNWKSKGFTKLEECKNESLERKNKPKNTYNKPLREEPVPEWVDKDIKKNKATEQERKEMEELLKEYQNP